jgi:small subunit ribosomal protein S17
LGCCRKKHAGGVRTEKQMFRRKKKEEQTDAPPAIETSESAVTEESATPAEASAPEPVTATPESQPAAEASATPPASDATAGAATKGRSGNRVQKVGTVSSDKMQKTVVVRVDRLVLHRKYRRYVRRTSKFMAHDELGATTGDRVRIVETRPLSTRKRWRVVEIVQKAAK